MAMLMATWEGRERLFQQVDDLVAKHIPYAERTAINRVANQAREDTYRAMESKLHMPTRYTMNSLFIRYATKAKPTAELLVKDRALVQKTGLSPAEVLRHLFEGGDRNFKRFEMALKKIGTMPYNMAAVPGAGAPLDANGNIPPSFIVQILAYFSAFGEQGYKANMTTKSRAAFERRMGRAAAGAGVQFFVSRGRGNWFGKRSWMHGRTQNLPMGIWQRTTFGHGSSIKPVIMFVKKPAYRRYFDLQAIAQEAMANVGEIEFQQALDYAMRTAR